jgi:hypothetical protein
MVFGLLMAGRAVRVHAVLCAILLILAAGLAKPAAAETQRMVIAPGCYHLAPGQYLDADAYCLDRRLAAPTAGAQLSNAPASLGVTEVKIGGGTAMPLQMALDRQIVRIEGVGGEDFTRVRVRNLTQSQVELCVYAPTVLTENQGDSIGDLHLAYDKIARILKPVPDSKASKSDEASRDEHDQRQEAVWQSVEAANDETARRRAADDVARHLGLVAKPVPGSTKGAPDKPNCVAQSTGGEKLMVCSGR